MTRSITLALTLTLAACAIEPTESTTDQALSANDVTHTYFSDATFTTEVGSVEAGVECGTGKRQTGRTSNFVVIDSVACNTGLASQGCYTWQSYGTGGQFVQIVCPSSLIYSGGL